MKKIAKGALVGGGIGLGLDATINDENEHSYLKSAFAGAALGGAAGVYGLSKISTQRTQSVVPTQTSAPIQGPQGLQVPKGPVGPKGLMGPQDVQVPQKTVTGFLNTSINIPNIDINPVKTWTTNVAKSVSDSVSGGISKIKDEASIIGNQVKSTISALNSKLVDAFEATRKIAATAKQAMVRPIKLNIPNPNISFPKIPEGVYDGISNVLEGGKRAISTYTKAGLIASAAMTAGHIPMQGPAFNPVAKITHAQSSMSFSQMTKPLISSISESAQQVESALKSAIPRAFEDSAAKKAFEASATKKVLDNYSDEIAQRIVINKKHNNKPFIVADPLTGTLSTYDTKGLRTGKYPALFGADQQGGSPGLGSLQGTQQEERFAQIMKSNMDDGYNWIAQNKARKINPGIYEYRKVPLPYGSRYGNTGLQDKNIFGRINGSPGLAAAIHNTYLGKPIEKRMQRLKSESIADNFISYGCINVDSKDLQQSVLPKMEKDVPFIMAPYDKASRSRYLGLSNDPMADNTMTAQDVVKNMKPSSNFVVADKKDNLLGVYSKSGELLDYFPISIGRDSGSSEVFQGGPMPKWTPDLVGFNKMIDATKRKITPSGVFEMKKQKYAPTGQEYIGDINYDQTSRQQFAIHSPFVNKNLLYPGNTVGNLSNGCMLPNEMDMQKILSKLGDRSIVAVMPNKGILDTGKITKYRANKNKFFSLFD